MTQRWSRHYWVPWGPTRPARATLYDATVEQAPEEQKSWLRNGAFTRPTRGREHPREGTPQEKPGLRASPDEPCHRRLRTVAHATCATHRTYCPHTYDTMAVQLTLERCGVVLLDRGRGGAAPGSQPQRSPTSATDSDSDPSALPVIGRVERMVNTFRIAHDGQGMANGQNTFRIANDGQGMANGQHTQDYP